MDDIIQLFAIGISRTQRTTKLSNMTLSYNVPSTSTWCHLGGSYKLSLECVCNFLLTVAVKCRGLGGAVTVRYSCDGCGLKGATFEAHSKCETVLAGSNTISVSLQVAFIIAGCTHATYYKALSHSLGIDTVSGPTFMCTIRAMHYIVESMLDEVCEAAKQEMRDVKESQLGSWKNAVMVADCTWQTRGWHSKNATFTIRNYLTGALLLLSSSLSEGQG